MKVYLAGTKTLPKNNNINLDEVFILSSFFEHKSGSFGDYVFTKNHMLDSGAFSILRGKTVDWNAYVQKYIDFIKNTNQKLFFELDIDSIIGLSKVEDIRDNIEQQTGLPTIPVWHKSRGLDYWHYLIDKYDYVAIGGLVSAGIGPSEYKYLSKMINMANKKKTKVHGLGFTKMDWLSKIKWHSVDSTTWLNAGRFGEIQWFDGRIIKKLQPRQMNKISIRSKSSDMLINNFNQWIKFQEYAKQNL